MQSVEKFSWMLLKCISIFFLFSKTFLLSFYNQLDFIYMVLVWFESKNSSCSCVNVAFSLNLKAEEILCSGLSWGSWPNWCLAV